MSTIKITYEKFTDMAYIYLKDPIEPGESATTYEVDAKELKHSIILDIDKDGRLLGIEVFEASSMLPQALLNQAEKL